MKVMKIKLGNSFLSTSFLIIFFLSIFVMSAEVFLRSKPVKTNLVPYLGSTHRQLEVQVARIKNFSESESNFNCIFIGSSMVWLGINPEVFSDSFNNFTGEELTCFNFGISAMPAGAAAVIAEVLVKEYQPEVLIFGTSARDYVVPVDVEDYKVITDTPWVQYQSGLFSIEGWLYTNSSFYSHLRNLNRLMRFDRTVFRDIGINNYDRTGFLPKIGVAPENTTQVGIEWAQKWLPNYRVLQENEDGLRKIAQYSDQNIQVIFFETPVKPEYYSFFTNGEADFNKYAKLVNTVSNDYGVPYIRTNQLNIIPVDGWWNENHLNLNGANTFSVWLGEQLGTLANHDQLKFISVKK